MPEIRPVTKENWQTLIDLKVRDDQKNFVASNLYSIAQAQFGDEFEGHWDLFAYGIYDGDTPVGFLMYGFNFSHPSQQAYIQRLMVDEKFPRARAMGGLGWKRCSKFFAPMNASKK